ncbi:AEC family transporter [Streptomyces sp. NPDC088910]|uniref:AEC family transporter n=1 Tax=Streptomyces sp. NPDC088910 TaxID=3365911 RepID=UPI00381106C4
MSRRPRSPLDPPDRPPPGPPCALTVSRKLFRHRQADQAIGAMCASYVNSANLGIPVAVHVLHDTSFIVAAAHFQMLFVTPLILVLIDLDTHRGVGALWRRMLRLPFRNPVIAASATALAAAATGLTLPAEVVSPVQLPGGAGVPSALFALGMSLHARSRPAPAARTERRLLAGLKTVVHPLLAYLLARYAFALSGHALFAAVLCAGLPTAQNAFIFASEYRLPTDLHRDTVLLSTLLSMVTLTLIAYALG